MPHCIVSSKYHHFSIWTSFFSIKSFIQRKFFCSSSQTDPILGRNWKSFLLVLFIIMDEIRRETVWSYLIFMFLMIIYQKKLPQFKKMKLPISYKINAYLGKQWEENLGNLKGKKITSKIIYSNCRATPKRPERQNFF